MSSVSEALLSAFDQSKEELVHAHRETEYGQYGTNFEQRGRVQDGPVPS